jgi:predicted DNA-binding transcriptional regulator YafY
MRLVADTKDEYKQLTRLQKLFTQKFKEEKEADPDSVLTKTLRKFISTSVEKSYEMPGKSTNVANTSSIMDTDDKTLFIAYIVHAATSRMKVAIEYKSAKGDVSKRLIEPHAWRNDQVVAWCHERGAWRQFKPHMMQRVAVTSESFDREDEVLIKASDAKDMGHLVNVS